MEQKSKKQGGFARMLSGLYLATAVLALVYVCRLCFPAVAAYSDRVWQQVEGSRAWHAFSQLTEALGEGEGVREAFAATYQELCGGMD